jgi:hypothetical protein
MLGHAEQRAIGSERHSRLQRAVTRARAESHARALSLVSGLCQRRGTGGKRVKEGGRDRA